MSSARCFNHKTSRRSVFEADGYGEACHNLFLGGSTGNAISYHPITLDGWVTYLGESSGMDLLVRDNEDSTDTIRRPRSEIFEPQQILTGSLDDMNMKILAKRGAFMLPPRSVCDELVDAYFSWVHPIMPMVRQADFMKQYHDPNNPPSLLLLQAMLAAGARVCQNTKILDPNGSMLSAAFAFYKRAKALYDASYERDRVTIVQSLLLLSWHWGGLPSRTEDAFYWSRIATTVAQDLGMHRSTKDLILSVSEVRLRKRIWWTLFTRDRSLAAALGRPTFINLDNSDIETITEDDFIDDESPSIYRSDPLMVKFFLQYVKLYENSDPILSQYSAASKGEPISPDEIFRVDRDLNNWRQECPEALRWTTWRHDFWTALLCCHYYTLLFLLYRIHIPSNGSCNLLSGPNGIAFTITSHAARMITSIIGNLAKQNELRYCPSFVVYSVFSASILHLYELDSSTPFMQQEVKAQLQGCVHALKELSQIWISGNMVQVLIRSKLPHGVLEDQPEDDGATSLKHMPFPLQDNEYQKTMKGEAILYFGFENIETRKSSGSLHP